MALYPTNDLAILDDLNPTSTSGNASIRVVHPSTNLPGAATASTPAASPPIITVISPTPGVAPGDPGGFAADYDSAKDTAIVIDVADADLEYVCVVARFPSMQDEAVVYRRGAFRGAFAGLSFAELLGTTLRLHCRRTGGWPKAANLNAVDDIEFDLDALDAVGNLT